MGRRPSTRAGPRSRILGPLEAIPAFEPSTLRPLPVAARGRFDLRLEENRTYRRAQGMLAEMAHCSLQSAGEALLQIGAQLGADTANGAANLFVRHAADAARSSGSQVAVGRFTTAAAHADRAEGLVPSVVATLVEDERGLEVRGELDIATAPVVAAAFADRRPGSAHGGRFLLDLRGVTFLDVHGVRALSDIDTQISATGHHLHVDPPLSAEAERILRLAVSLGWLAPLFAARVAGPVEVRRSRRVVDAVPPKRPGRNAAAK